MARTSGGYTIVEVMIVLAVSGVLLFSALTVVGGQQQRTSFNQAMQDIASMIQSYASQIQAGNYPNLEGQHCQLVALGGTSGTRPQIGGTATDECIELGDVFQVERGNGNIYIYPVMGAQLNSSGQLVSGIDDPGAAPEPITNSGLFDTYTIGAGATVWASNNSFGGDDLAGIYSQLESGGGNQALTMRLYPYQGLIYPGQNQHLNWCVEETNQGGQNCTAVNIQTINRWNLCVSSDSAGSKIVAIETYTSPSGVTTNINYSPAAGECD